jgi:hypothetical protein
MHSRVGDSHAYRAREREDRERRCIARALFERK